jgi:hypothetical protein
VGAGRAAPVLGGIIFFPGRPPRHNPVHPACSRSSHTVPTHKHTHTHAHTHAHTHTHTHTHRTLARPQVAQGRASADELREEEAALGEMDGRLRTLRESYSSLWSQAGGVLRGIASAAGGGGGSPGGSPGGSGAGGSAKAAAGGSAKSSGGGGGGGGGAADAAGRAVYAGLKFSGLAVRITSDIFASVKGDAEKLLKARRRRAVLPAAACPGRRRASAASGGGLGGSGLGGCAVCRLRHRRSFAAHAAGRGPRHVPAAPSLSRGRLTGRRFDRPRGRTARHKPAGNITGATAAQARARAACTPNPNELLLNTLDRHINP